MSLLSIIDGMKGLNCSPLFWCHGVLKKCLTMTQSLDGFVGPVTFLLARLMPFIRRAVVGFGFRSRYPGSVSEPSTAYVNSLYFHDSGWNAA